jgi:hypothetical protein
MPGVFYELVTSKRLPTPFLSRGKRSEKVRVPFSSQASEKALKAISALPLDKMAVSVKKRRNNRRAADVPCRADPGSALWLILTSQRDSAE